MKHSTSLLGFSAALAGTLAFVGCGSSDNPTSIHFGGSGGASGAAGASGVPGGGAAGVTAAGSSGLGGSSGSGGDATVGGGSAGTAGMDQSGGTAGVAGGAGNGGASAGANTAGGGAAGGGGAPVVIDPAIVLVDTILLRPKAVSGGGGAGGAGTSGAAGAAAGGGAGAEVAGAGGGAGASGAGGGTGGGGVGGGGAAGASGGGAGGSAGGGGAPGVVDHSRSYTFDADPQTWATHAEGSTPNIGTAGGGEKLSAQTVLSVNTADGVPKLGALQLNIPFSHTGEQLDINQYFAAAGVTAEEDWTGYELVAKIKLALGGDLGTCLGAWEYATSDGFIFARSPEVLLKAADGWVDMRFDLDAPDSGAGQTVIPPSTASFDKTKVNQFGIMVESYHCP